jgi:CO/xanthine dehydrogenase Mo-binding subunit
MDVPLAYFLSSAAGRPVAMRMTSPEDLQAANPRHAAIVRVTTGILADGSIHARDCEILFDGGAYAGFKPLKHVNLAGVVQGGGSYRIPHVRIEGRCLYTNHVPGGHFRAPGEPQVLFAIESATDMIAREIGWDPLEFRRHNLLRPDDLDPLGRSLEDLRIGEVLEAALARSAWHEPRPPNVGRGLAVYHRKQAVGTSSARVTLDAGGVSIHTALPDTGTGLHLTLRKLVARELGLPAGAVRCVAADTSSIPPDDGVGATRVTIVAGQAAQAAAVRVRAELIERLARRFECAPEEIVLGDGGVRAPDIAVSFAEATAFALRPDETIEATETRQADPQRHSTISTAQVAEVEVDPETGQVHVRSIVSAHDVGEVFNPVQHQGQIEGGLAQGLGFALMEDLGIHGGRVAAATFADYKIPVVTDMPRLVTVLVRQSSGTGPHSSKAIAEASISGVAPAIANAIADATGVRVTTLPLTAERIRAGRLEVAGAAAGDATGRET